VIIFLGLVWAGNQIFSGRPDRRKALYPDSCYQKILESLDSTISVQVFLTGDLPADYRKLNQSVQDLLSELKSLPGGQHLNISFENLAKTFMEIRPKSCSTTVWRNSAWSLNNPLRFQHPPKINTATDHPNSTDQLQTGQTHCHRSAQQQKSLQAIQCSQRRSAGRCGSHTQCSRSPA